MEYDICKVREKELSVRKRPYETAEQWEGRRPSPCPGPTPQPLGRKLGSGILTPTGTDVGRPGTRMAPALNPITGLSHQGRHGTRERESDLGWHSAAATRHVFDAFNGFPGPLPSQASCQAKLADSWAARASLPQLVSCSKQLMSTARLGYQERPGT